MARYSSLPKGLLRAYLDPESETVFLSLCAPPEAREGFSPSGSPFGQRDELFAMLLLLSLCDAVVMLRRTANIGTAWIKRLRQLSGAWQSLQMELEVRSTKGRDDAAFPQFPGMMP